MQAFPFQKDLSWWPRVFKAPAGRSPPPYPQEILDVVSPVFNVLGSYLHQGKSLWTVNGAGNDANPKMALVVPIDEIWLVDCVEAACTDAAVDQWVYLLDIFQDGSSYIDLTSQVVLTHGTVWKLLFGPSGRLVLPGGHKLGIRGNGLAGGAAYNFRFTYVPLKVGETVEPY